MLKEKIKELNKKFTKDTYAKFIKGKKVVVVGPNTHLKGKGLGEYIDSFDVVVRHNTVFDFLPFDSEYQKDYGSRTDIIYWSPSCIKKYAFKQTTISTLKKAKVKFIVYQNGNKNRRYLIRQYCFPKSLSWFKVNISASGAKMHYSHSSAYALTKMMNAKGLSKLPIVPRTGFISIFDMLVHGAESIETIGMSFKEGGGHSFRPEAVKEMDPLKTHKGLESPHNSNIEVALVEDFMKEYPNKIKFG